MRMLRNETEDKYVSHDLPVFRSGIIKRVWK